MEGKSSYCLSSRRFLQSVIRIPFELWPGGQYGVLKERSHQWVVQRYGNRFVGQAKSEWMPSSRVFPGCQFLNSLAFSSPNGISWNLGDDPIYETKWWPQLPRFAPSAKRRRASIDILLHTRFSAASKTLLGFACYKLTQECTLNPRKSKTTHLHISCEKGVSTCS